LDRKTTYGYASDSTGTTVTTTYDDGSTHIEHYDLDGALTAVTGTSVAAPSMADEGVVSSDITDNNNNVLVPAGSTWVESGSNEVSGIWQNTTLTYTNMLGQTFRTEQSGPNSATAVSTTTYDGNNRPSTTKDFDGTNTHTDYNPMTGAVQDDFIDTNGDGQYTQGVDQNKTLYSPTPASPNDSTPAGETDTQFSSSGADISTSGTSNGGLTSTQNNNGAKTTTTTTLGTNGGSVVTTSNPDGSFTEDTYTAGTLAEEDSYSNQDLLIAKTTFGHDALGRNNKVTSWRPDSGGALTVPQATTYTLRDDGSVSDVQYPDGRTQSVDETDDKSGVPTTSVRADGGTVHTPVNAKGQQTSQSGAGVLPATFTYDPHSGQLSDITTFTSGTLGTTSSSDAQDTHFIYDPASGLLTNEQYGYTGSGYAYQTSLGYNNKGQLNSITKPGVSVGGFVYDNAGDLTKSITTDIASGTTITNEAGFDDGGRVRTVSQVTADSSGNILSQAQDGFAYNANGQVTVASQVAGVVADYHYYGLLDSSGGAQPNALHDITLDQYGMTLATTEYTYDSIGRVQTVVMAGDTTFTYHYKAGTNLVSGIDVSFAGVTGNTLSTAYGYESNTDRLSSITATAGSNTVYSAGYTYSDNDQRQTESVSQHQPGASTSSDSHNWTFGYDSKDELTSVTPTGGGSSIYSMSYDGSGNRIDSSLGTPNSINEYPNLSYDGRGDETNNGTLAFTWDAQGHLVAVTPDSPTTGSTKETNFYDGQNRLIEEDTSTYTGTTWGLPNVQKFVYNGTQLVEILDGENNDVEDFAWAPNGVLLGIQRGSTAYAVVTDGTTNATELVNAATGAIVAEEQIAPFGAPIISTGAAADFTFFNMAGMRYDKASGLYYAVNRWYDSSTGEFLNADPADVQGGYNLRSYCNNDPINSVDPNGTEPRTLFGPDKYAPIAGNVYRITNTFQNLGIDTSPHYSKVERVEMALWSEWQANEKYDAAHGGWFARSGLADPAQQQLDAIMDRPHLTYSWGNLGAASQYLAGKHPAGALPTDQDLMLWSQKQLVTSSLSIEASMIGFRQDLSEGEKMTPVYGKARQAYFDYRRGDYVLMGANIVNAATELYLVGAVYRGLANFFEVVTEEEIAAAAEAWNAQIIAEQTGQEIAAADEFADIYAARTGIPVNPSGIPNPLVDVTRTTPAQLVAAARAEFKLVTGRKMFLDEFASTPEAQARFTEAQLADMRNGEVPDEWVVGLRGGKRVSSMSALSMMPRNDAANFPSRSRIKCFIPARNPPGAISFCAMLVIQFSSGFFVNPAT
jgi:RHS repeat-associated protein